MGYHLSKVFLWAKNGHFFGKGPQKDQKIQKSKICSHTFVLTNFCKTLAEFWIFMVSFTRVI